jgi:hypothetical protein
MAKQPDERVELLKRDLEALQLDVQVHKAQLGRVQAATVRLAKSIQMLCVQQPRMKQS